MMTNKFHQKVIDETDSIKARVQELARHYRDTDAGYHYGMAAVELDRVVVLLTRDLKGEEPE